MDLSSGVVNAYDVEFHRALNDPKQLVIIHRKLQQGRGRRTLELSLNRAIIVLTVAAWQAYVEALARAIFDSLGPPTDVTTPGRTLAAIWEGRRAEVENMIDRYSTPNADNTLGLFRAVGFHPEDSWTWGQGHGEMKPGQIKDRLNRWVSIRHSIAHGSELPPAAEMLVTKNKSGLTIRLKDAEACLHFVERTAEATDVAARALATRSDRADMSFQMAETRE